MALGESIGYESGRPTGSNATAVDNVPKQGAS